MKRIAKILFMAGLASILTCNVAFASSDVPSLDEITSSSNETTVTPEPEQKQGGSSDIDVQENKENIISDLSKGADMSQTDEGAARVGRVIQKWVGKAVQIISYIIIAGLALRVVMDLMYIGIPFLRSILANGFMGNPNAGGDQQGSQGGIGRFNNYDGLGSGMGVGSGMGIGNNMVSQRTAMNNQPKSGRIQFISNAALNAVATENTVGPDGEAHSPFKTYVKDMAVILIVTPILITLAATGILARLGFAIAGLIVKGINALMGGM